MINREKKILNNVLFWNILVVSLVNILFGLIAGIIEKECTPHSMAGYINIPFRISCEFTKPRFNLGGKR